MYDIRPQTHWPWASALTSPYNIIKPKPNAMTGSLVTSSACEYHTCIQRLIDTPMIGGNASVAR